MVPEIVTSAYERERQTTLKREWMNSMLSGCSRPPRLPVGAKIPRGKMTH